ICFVRNVGAHKGGVTAGFLDLPNDFCSFFLSASGQHNLCASPGKLHRRGFADAGGSSGHQRYFTFKCVVVGVHSVPFIVLFKKISAVPRTVRFRRSSAENGSGLVTWKWTEVAECETIALARLSRLQIQLRDVRLNQIGKNQMREQGQVPSAQFFLVEDEMNDF